MAGNIPGTKYSTSDFLSKFGNLAQSSQYRVHWAWPTEVSSYLRAQRIPNILMNEGSVLCKATSLPGSSLNTHDASTEFYGVTEKSAYRRTFDGSIDLTFFIDSDYGMLYMFEGWMEYIMQMVGSSSDPLNKGISYRASYPESYRCPLYLYKFNKDHQGVASSRRGVHGAASNIYGRPGDITYTFVDAFPQNISSTSVSYDPSANLEFTVTFAYTRYVTDRTLTRNGGGAGSSSATRNQAVKTMSKDNPSNPIFKNNKKNILNHIETWRDNEGEDYGVPVEGSPYNRSLVNQETGEGGQVNQAVKGQNVNNNNGGGNSTIDGAWGDFGATDGAAKSTERLKIQRTHSV